MIKVVTVAKSGLVIPGVNVCEHCRKKLRIGDNVLVTQLFDEAFVKKGAYAHVECVRDVIDAVPDNRTVTFTDLRERISATGKAFPE